MKESKQEKKLQEKFQLASSKLNEFGSIIFGVGLLIVLVGSMIQLSTAALSITIAILAVMGAIVGIFNITREESVSFLIASLVLVLLLGQFGLLLSQYFLQAQAQAIITLLTLFNALLIPAAIVVALKVFFSTGKDR